ncbi:hypothetical protein JHK82_036159 [Glycine max]|uniref:Uncharacterized protein n=2 Tax=Glycine subgen. Soja TaxID=1462606 RepID=A0A0R0GN34_SOYBN|nr:hypothetical protein JHK87_036082 [Glycine soja]KAG4970475.1 hypothetical protein JHK85_036896 [Glycine max]KAG4976874.1 hypothetical protein JHK86_036348 [Glycine max]KAG5112890.1 hypothetical protein JHK82_036159 [Glycine max]KAG5130172.1 hypothetical protein JHK84_036569 [Glycine max]
MSAAANPTNKTAVTIEASTQKRSTANPPNKNAATTQTISILAKKIVVNRFASGTKSPKIGEKKGQRRM